MSGDAFMSTLRKLEYPKVDKLSAQFFDRHFANQEATRSFITWFCKTLNSKHVVAAEEIQKFEELENSGANILEGSKLSESLAELKTKKELLASKEKLLDEELEICQMRKDMLLQSKLPMEHQNSVIRTHITKTHELVEKSQNEYAKVEQACYQDAHMMNKTVPELVKTVRSISDQLQPSKERNRVNYFSHVQLADYYGAEEKFGAEVDGFFQKRFTQRSEKFGADRDIKSRYDLLGISRPEIALIYGLSEDVFNTMNQEIKRIRNIYPISEETLITAKINRECVSTSISAMEVILTALRDRKISWISQAKLMEDSKKLRSNSNVLKKLFQSELLPLIQRNKLMQENEILDCCCDLKLARQEYYLDRLDQVLEQVLWQKARYEFISTCCQVEKENHHNMHYLLTSVYIALSAMKHQSESRQDLLDNFSTTNVEARNASSYKNKFLKTLKAILTTSTMSDCDDMAAGQLYIDNARMRGVAQSLHTTAGNVMKDLNKLEMQRELKFQKMNSVIQKGIQRLYCEAQFHTTPNIPVTPAGVEKTLIKLKDNLAVLYKELEAIDFEFKNKKVRCKADPFLEQEREMFVYFHTNPAKLEQCVKTIESRVEAKKITQE